MLYLFCIVLAYSYLCTHEYNKRTATTGHTVAGRSLPREGQPLFEVFHRELSAQGTMPPLARGAVCRYAAICPNIHESPQSESRRRTLREVPSERPERHEEGHDPLLPRHAWSYGEGDTPGAHLELWPHPILRDAKRPAPHHPRRPRDHCPRLPSQRLERPPHL